MIEQLILVRHGETLHNVAGTVQGWSDSELSERGQTQIAQLAERIRRLEPDAIYSSPLQRAMTTAAALATATGLNVQPLDEFREMNYGRWEGQSFLDIRKSDVDVFKRWMSDDDYPSPEGESHRDVFTRLARGIQSIDDAVRPVVVTHGTAIRIAVAVLLDLPLAASRRFAQDNTGVNIFLRRGDRWILKLWNDTTHCGEG